MNSSTASTAGNSRIGLRKHWHGWPRGSPCHSHNLRQKTLHNRKGPIRGRAFSEISVVGNHPNCTPEVCPHASCMEASLASSDGTFLEYVSRVLKRLNKDAASWARDNIFWGIVMLLAPLAVLYWQQKTIDWGLVQTTLWIYLAAFVIYLCIHLNHTPQAMGDACCWLDR